MKQFSVKKMVVRPFKSGRLIRSGGGRVIRMDSQYYNTEELAALVGLSVMWVIKWRSRIVGAVKIGGRWRFDKSVIDRRLAVKKDIRSGF